jgi:hypothetical protein
MGEMRRSLVVLLCLALHCDRPVVDVRPAASLAEAAPPTPLASAAPVTLREDAGRTIASIRYGHQTATGGVDLTCTHDGAAIGSYFNPGFSPSGAEIVPVSKTMTPGRVADLWSAAAAVVQAMPGAHQAADASWHGSSSIVIHFTEGSDVVLYWPGDGPHPDERVRRLAALLEQVLSDR